MGNLVFVRKSRGLPDKKFLNMYERFFYQDKVGEFEDKK